MVTRILKYLTILILILILGFFLLGFFVDTVEYNSEVIVNGPLESVFEAYNDMDNISEWIPEVKSIKPLKETETMIGSVYEMVIDSDGTEVTMNEELIAYLDNQLVALKFETGAMIKLDKFEFSDINGRTKIGGYHIVEGTNYFYKCMFALFGKAMGKVDQKNADNFKKYYELK